MPLKNVVPLAGTEIDIVMGVVLLEGFDGLEVEVQDRFLVHMFTCRTRNSYSRSKAVETMYLVERKRIFLADPIVAVSTLLSRNEGIKAPRLCTILRVMVRGIGS